MKKIYSCFCLLVCLFSFSLVACHNDIEDPQCPIADGVHIRFVLDDGTETEIINEEHIADIKIMQDSNNLGYWIVRLTLTKEGTELFAIASEKYYLDTYIAILITPPNGTEEFLVSRPIGRPINNGILSLGYIDLNTAQDYYSYFTTGRSLSYWQYYEATGEYPPS